MDKMRALFKSAKFRWIVVLTCVLFSLGMWLESRNAIKVEPMGDVIYSPRMALGDGWYLVEIKQPCEVPHPIIPDRAVTIEVPHLVRLHESEMKRLCIR